MLRTWLSSGKLFDEGEGSFGEVVAELSGHFTAMDDSRRGRKLNLEMTTHKCELGVESGRDPKELGGVDLNR